MRRLSIAAMAVAVSITAACSGQSAADRTAAARPKDGVVDVSVLHFADTDYVDAADPAENAKARWSDVVVSGTVKGFSLGRVHFPGGDTALHKVVLKVKVDRKLKGDDKYTSDGNLYVEMWGGRDANPAKFNDAIPQGTPVVVFGSGTLMADSKAADADAGHPAGTALVSGLHPQSVFFEGIPASANAAKAATVIPAQQSLAAFGDAWTQINTLDELLQAAKPGLS